MGIHIELEHALHQRLHRVHGIGQRLGALAEAALVSRCSGQGCRHSLDLLFEGIVICKDALGVPLVLRIHL